MPNIVWDVNRFRQLSVDQLFEILRLRIDVFVVEQRCAYPELDDFDPHPDTRHLCGQDPISQLIAYARLLPPGLQGPEVRLGRLVVKKEARGQGRGHQLLQEALKAIQAYWPGQPIKISAQDYLQKFYEQYGFVRVSEVYLDFGVPHIEMVRKG